MPIKQILTIDEMSHQIVTGYQLRGLLFASVIFRPFYYKWFDTHQRRKLTPLAERHNVKYSEIPGIRAGKRRRKRKASPPAILVKKLKKVKKLIFRCLKIEN